MLCLYFFFFKFWNYGAAFQENKATYRLDSTSKQYRSLLIGKLLGYEYHHQDDECEKFFFNPNATAFFKPKTKTATLKRRKNSP
ncbi:UNVERIFIED_CONTAM: hypothetical protein NCL1_53651 [Trichonephila clavipes]